MAEEFNREAAAIRHEELLREIERMRDGINADVIEFYLRNPETAKEESEKREGIRKYLRIAEQRINDLLDNWLRS